jgi:hypothetical protein
MATATETDPSLFEALKAHTINLETERDSATGPRREVLEQRLEAAKRLLEWLSTTLEPASPETLRLNGIKSRWSRAET